MKNFLLGTLSFLMVACGQGVDKAPATTDPARDSATGVVEKVPLRRDSVSKEPVASYRVRTDNPLNEWYFQVRLFETPNTFHYLIKLEFEEINGEDTLKLPNFGLPPKPVIQKGPQTYSCIIGFMDMDNKFREYKKVYVKDNHLKIVALKHYGVRGL